MRRRRRRGDALSPDEAFGRLVLGAPWTTVIPRPPQHPTPPWLADKGVQQCLVGQVLRLGSDGGIGLVPPGLVGGIGGCRVPGLAEDDRLAPSVGKVGHGGEGVLGLGLAGYLVGMPASLELRKRRI